MLIKRNQFQPSQREGHFAYDIVRTNDFRGRYRYTVELYDMVTLCDYVVRRYDLRRTFRTRALAKRYVRLMTRLSKDTLCVQTMAYLERHALVANHSHDDVLLLAIANDMRSIALEGDGLYHVVECDLTSNEMRFVEFGHDYEPAAYAMAEAYFLTLAHRGGVDREYRSGIRLPFCALTQASWYVGDKRMTWAIAMRDDIRLFEGPKSTYYLVTGDTHIVFHDMLEAIHAYGDAIAAKAGRHA